MKNSDDLGQRSPVGKSVVIYGIAFAIAGVTPFVLLPILTKYLSPRAFGEATSFLMLAGMITSIASLSAHGFVSVRYFKESVTAFRSVVSTAITAVGVTHALAALLVLAFAGQLRAAVDLPPGLMVLAALAALFLSMNLVFLAIYQSSGQPLQYLKARGVQALIEISLCIGLIFLMTPDAEARVVSYTAALATVAAYGAWYCAARGYLGRAVDKGRLAEMLKFGLPMIPHIVAGTTIAYLDRMMVSSLLGTESLGIYMVAMQIGLAMSLVIEPLNKALAPWLFEQLSKQDAATNRMVVKNTYRFYLVLGVIGLVVVGAAHLFFDYLIGPKFHEAKPLIVWMVLGVVFQGMYYSVVNYLFYAEKTGRLSVVSSLTAASATLVSYLMISKFGITGAAVSFAVNNCILFLLVWLVASKAVPMPWLLKGQANGSY